MDVAVKRLYISMFFPGVFLLVIWLIFIVQVTLPVDLVYHGLYPRKISGLQGILFAPLIHGGFRHIFANSLPLFALSTLLFYFYRNLSFKVLIFCYFLPEIFVWMIGRPSYHVGASGLIYGLAGFLFVSGLIRKHLGLMAISFLVAFQYGSMIWGIFPIEDQVSWESHLCGLLTGIGLAWFYRDQGPRGRHLFWEGPGPIEDEEDGDSGDDGSLPWDDYEVEGPRKPPSPSEPAAPQKDDSSINYIISNENTTTESRGARRPQ